MKPFLIAFFNGSCERNAIGRFQLPLAHASVKAKATILYLFCSRRAVCSCDRSILSLFHAAWALLRAFIVVIVVAAVVVVLLTKFVTCKMKRPSGRCYLEALTRSVTPRQNTPNTVDTTVLPIKQPKLGCVAVYIHLAKFCAWNLVGYTLTFRKFPLRHEL